MTSPWYDWIDVGGRYGSTEPGYVHKFQRAVTHLNAITQETGDFLAEGLHAPSEREYESEGEWIILRPGPTRQFPGAWPLYLGDFLTNAKASLDYLVYDLVAANNNDPGTHTGFPICETPGQWRVDIIERDSERGPAPTTGMSENALALIHGAQPLRHRNAKARQNDPLMHLLRMCNADKHRSLRAAAIYTGKVLQVWAEPEGLVDVIRMKPAVIPDGPTEGDREVARIKTRAIRTDVDPNTQIRFGYKRAAQIAFSRPGQLGKPAMLEDLFGIVNSIMDIGKSLELHTKSGSTWFDDLFAGRIGGAHRASP